MNLLKFYIKDNKLKGLVYFLRNGEDCRSVFNTGSISRNTV